MRGRGRGGLRINMIENSLSCNGLNKELPVLDCCHCQAVERRGQSLGGKTGEKLGADKRMPPGKKGTLQEKTDQKNGL